MNSGNWLLITLVPLVFAGHIRNTDPSIMNSDDDETVEKITLETIELINAGEEGIDTDEAQKDVVLLIGNTGAGKSTMTKFITGQDLTSYRSGSRYLIKDQVGGISFGSTLVSHTTFPENYHDRPTNTVYYDLPGFGDTRNTSMEIANAYFMKKVADHARRVKILCIINYTSLRFGESKTDFPGFLKHALDFIMDPAKFKLGLALIATKVPHNIPEEEVVPEIIDFLTQAKEDIKTIISDPGKLQGATALMDALLTTSMVPSYGRIGYFKQPDIAGPLSQIPGMSSQQTRLRNMIEQNIQFVNKTSGDFGISLSKKALSYTTKLLDKLNQQFVSILNSAGLAIETSNRGKFENVSKPSTTEIGKLVLEVKQMKKLSSALQAASSRGEFIAILERESLRLLTLQPTVKQLSRLSGHLNFYENLDNKTAESQKFLEIDSLKNALDYLEMENAGQLQALNSQLMLGIDRYIISMISDWDSNIAKLGNASLEAQQTFTFLLSMQTGIIRLATQELAVKSTFNKFIGALIRLSSLLSFISQHTRNAVPTNLLLTDDVMIWGQPLLTRKTWMQKFLTMHTVLKDSVSVFEMNVQERVNQEKILILQAKMEKINREAALEAAEAQGKIQQIEQQIIDMRTSSVSKTAELENLRAEMERVRENQRLGLIETNRRLAESSAAADAERRRKAETQAQLERLTEQVNRVRQQSYATWRG